MTDTLYNFSDLALKLQQSFYSQILVTTTIMILRTRKIEKCILQLMFNTIFFQNILQGWIPKRRTPIESPDEPVYPAANGGYYNRNVYSDSYFAPNHTLRRQAKRERKPTDPPPDIVSPGPVYARVGPPGNSWRGGSPQLSSFAPQRQVYHASTRSEPGSKLL